MSPGAGGPVHPGGRRRRWRLPALVIVASGAALQLVPYGWRHPNPPVVADAPWPDPGVERLARTACYSCHSNEVDWPPHAFVAPVSWLVRRDVEQARDELNFSRWDRDAGEARDAAEVVAEGSMPPLRFTLVHPDADLDAAERRALIDALLAMERDR